MTGVSVGVTVLNDRDGVWVKVVATFFTVGRDVGVFVGEELALALLVAD